MWPFKKVNSPPIPLKEDIYLLCPYCGFDLQIMPKRKKKCPACTKPIYIKYTPDNRKKRLMTEEQANDAEKQWDLHGLRQSSIDILSMFGLDESEIEKQRAMGAKNDDEAVFTIVSQVTMSNKYELHEWKLAYLILASLA